MIIEVDKFKEKIEGYDPERSEDFHIESGKLADVEFRKQLKNSIHKRVVLMAGGSASGKSEYAQTFLMHKDQLVYDGTLKNFHGFKVKNDKIKRYSKHSPKIKVVYILPVNWEESLEVFLSRERKMELKTFFGTHAKSAFTVSRIFSDTDCRVEIYLSSFNKKRDRITYQRMTLSRRSKTATVLDEFGKKLVNISRGYGIEIGI